MALALSSGTKLGPYEIIGAAGAGGMGEVYRAHDTRLDRTVAIKVLPSHLSSNPHLKERFEREARSISKLNHPHICVLHDIGQQDGVDYLVMEYIEGETLGQRLEKGPLPLEQVLKIGIEIADALDKAHRQGIIHRDLKPGNIMLTKSGAKLMDFGLAKPAAAALVVAGSAGGALTPSSPTSPTASLARPVSPLTAAGTIVGTFQYMAPEVVQGQEADGRSDVFSFGCVLYEMATGKRAFEGKSQISVLAAILEKEPEPISKLHPTAPPALEWVVKTCLAKDPEERWQAAHDVAIQLKYVSQSSTQLAAAVSAVKPRRKHDRMAWITAALAGVAALVLAISYYTVATRPGPVIRATILPAEKAVFDFTGDYGGPPELSPDGRYLVFAAHPTDGQRALWIRALGSASAQRLDGTENASFPFWSADSRFIGFFADNKLKKIAATGGPVTTLADTPNARGGSWSKDNVILYTPDFRNPVFRVSADGGQPVQVTKVDGIKHTTHRWPVFLPDGQHFLYLATNHSGGRPADNGIYFASLDGKENKLVIATDASGFHASGYLLFHSGTSLMAQAFDPGRGKLSGEARPVMEKVAFDPGVWRVLASASQTGMMAYQAGTAAGGSELIWHDRQGKQIGKVGGRERYASPQLSPDGRQLAVVVGDPLTNVFVFNLGRGVSTRLTFDSATHSDPAWSPDGKQILFTSRGGGPGVGGFELHIKPANGAGEDQLVLKPSDPADGFSLPQWSPDGHYIIFHRQSAPSGASLWALPLTDDRKPFLVIKPESAQGNITGARLSPDGLWIAYSSTDSGQEEVYVSAFPKPAGKWQVSNNGFCPAWRRDGKELYVQRNDGMILAAEVSAQGSQFQVGAVRPLFRANTPALGYPYDVSADGRRFLVNTAPQDTSTPITLVVNWTAELKK